MRGLVNLVPAACERDIFDALGLEYREPWDRNCEATAKANPALGHGHTAGADGHTDTAAEAHPGIEMMTAASASVQADADALTDVEGNTTEQGDTSDDEPLD